MEFKWRHISTQENQSSSSPRSNLRSGEEGKQTFKFIQGKSAQKRRTRQLPKGQNSAGLFAKFRVDVTAEKSPSWERVPDSTDTLATQNDNRFQVNPTENTRAQRTPGSLNIVEKQYDSLVSSEVSSRSFDTTPSDIVSQNPSPQNDWNPSYEFSASDFDTQVADTTSLELHPYASQLSPLSRRYGSSRTCGLSPTLSYGVQYRSLAHKYSVMFSLFNEQYCVVPLSTDCLDNPFRAREDFAESYTFLSHAVMALTSHHLSKKLNSEILQRDTQNHWSTALQLLSTALAHTGISPLLDTILLLINFGSTQSAFVMLDMHLCGAKRLLEQPGAMIQLCQSSRMRAQVAMLVWWDVTSALMSRQRPRLADPYLSILQVFKESDGWSFLTLAGCPSGFVLAMARLATMAHRHEQEPLSRVTYDIEVRPILDQVRRFVLISDFSLSCSSGLDFKDADGALNRKYCIEAWRHAILLYAQRVFTATQTDQDLLMILYHSRMILDSARCIPPKEPFQKQLLLPVFLAGAEVGDTFNRLFVRRYCEHWSNSCNFDQFSGALSFLEDIWVGWSGNNRKTYWWGVKVGNEHTPAVGEGDCGLQKELLLG